MQYKGIELVEMVPEKWDGNLRTMLVWDCVNDNTPLKARIVDWYKNGQGHVIWRDDSCKFWNYCAEIPKEEILETNEESYITNNLTEEEIIEKFKTLRTELKRWLKNNDSRNLLVNNLQYGIKTALNLTNVNHHYIDVVDFSNLIKE